MKKEETFLKDLSNGNAGSLMWAGFWFTLGGSLAGAFVVGVLVLASLFSSVV